MSGVRGRVMFNGVQIGVDLAFQQLPEEWPAIFSPSSALDFPGSETAGIPSRRHRPSHSRASQCRARVLLADSPNPCAAFAFEIASLLLGLVTIF